MSKDFKIQPDLPKTTQVNKTLLLVISSVVAFVLIFAIVGAFNEKPTTARHTAKALIPAAQQNQVPVVSDVIKNLPQSYQDISKIKQFQELKANNVVPPEVEQELDFLKEQQVELQQKLATLNVEGAASHENPANQQAQNSSLFFPGTMPVPEEYLTKKPGQEEDKTKNANQASANGSASSNSTFEQVNMQDQKIKFMQPSDEAEDIYDLHSIVEPVSPYEVQAGTMIPSVLITGINTSLPGDVVAQVRQDIYDSVTGRFLLVPKGSKLLGEYDSKVSYGQRRVLIAFTRIIRPDGSSIVLSKVSGADLKGQAGMEGLVDNHWISVLTAATLSTMLSVGTGLTADNNANPNINYQTAKQGAILGASNNISQVGENLTDRAMNVQPTLIIQPGFHFNVIVKKDMVMSPYKLSTNKSSLLSIQ